MEFLEIHLANPWIWFLIFFCLFLVCTVVMSRQSRHFKYLRGTAVIPFSIIDLEFPGTPASIPHIIEGIRALRNETGKRSRKALKANLTLDFLFMCGVYPSIFLLCMYAAQKMGTTGRSLLLILAWLQALAFLFDILENIYLLRKMKNPVISTLGAHLAYKRMVSAKWIIAVAGTVCALSCMLYFWLNGNYSHRFYIVGMVFLVLIVLLLVHTLSSTLKALFHNKADEVEPVVTREHS